MWIDDFISGELLGDMGISSYDRPSARIGYGSKYFEYVNWISEILSSRGIEQSGRIRKYNLKTGIAFIYRSKSYGFLKFIFDKWYNSGKKQPPLDINFNPIVLRQWYIGDGCLIVRKHRSSRIKLSTQGFAVDGNIFLTKKLNILGFVASYNILSNCIFISYNSVRKFLDYIGPCPVDCYQYKWGVQNLD